MDIIFQGFQSPLPFWSYLLIFLGCAGLSWWSYQKKDSGSATARYTLIALRSAVFFILILVLLNPFFKTKSSYSERPNLLVMLDNSSSTAIKKASYKGTKSYKKLLSDLNLDDSSSVDYTFKLVGNHIKKGNPDSLTFDDSRTNLYQAVNAIKEADNKTDAAILISDGIYTHGENPVFKAKEINTPIFTVGLGDTLSQQDLLVQSVSSPSKGYVNTRQPVSATIKSNGFKGESFQVELRDGSEILDTQTVSPTLMKDTKEVDFSLPLKNEGLHQFSVNIPKHNEEWSADNNRQRFTVDINDARQNILSLAFEVHPDVGYLRGLLLSDRNTNLTKRTWLGGNHFVEGSFSASADSLDLLVIHGYPRLGLPESIKQKLKKIAQHVPLVIANTPNFAPRRFEDEITALPVTVSGPWQSETVKLYPLKAHAAHPIMDITDVSYRQLPPLHAPIKNIGSSPSSTTLLNLRYQDNTTDTPAVAIKTVGNKRLSMILPYGWFRIQQDDNPGFRTFSKELLLNIVSWTAADPDKQLLEITPAQQTFSGSENVVLDAYLKNEGGSVESDAVINLTIGSDETSPNHFAMDNRGDGHYNIDLGTLPEGIYQFSGTAKKEGRKIEEQSGEFGVARSNAEFISTKRNSRLLKLIASQTNGHYYPYDDISGFWDDLRDKQLLESNTKYRTSFYYLYRHYGWFIAVIILLSAEWVLRKYWMY